MGRNLECSFREIAPESGASACARVETEIGANLHGVDLRGHVRGEIRITRCIYGRTLRLCLVAAEVRALIAGGEGRYCAVNLNDDERQKVCDEGESRSQETHGET